ncbi:MAG: hypothetical protein COC23_01650 [Hyphomicrobiales bacterium]|nr:MAG: hypothetical protein COC23_01650 [Hyphomicrobiales bacterium]
MNTQFRKMQKNHTSFRDKLASFIDGEAGVSAIEFALVAPFLITLFLGFTEIARASQMSTLVSKVSSTVADIISQSPKLSIAEVDAALQAAYAVAGTSAADNMTVEVVGVTVFDNGTTQVSWARGVNSNNLPTVGSSYTLPSSLTSEAGFIVASRSFLLFQPAFADALLGDFALETKNYYIPRSGSMTNCTDC